MAKNEDYSIRKICKIGNGKGIFLTKELKKLGWTTQTYVVVKTQDNMIVLRKVDVSEK